MRDKEDSMFDSALKFFDKRAFDSIRIDKMADFIKIDTRENYGKFDNLFSSWFLIKILSSLIERYLMEDLVQNFLIIN